MNNLPDYYLSTNAAYEILKLYDGNYPQINIRYILSQFKKNVSVHSYSEAARRIGVTIWEFVSEYAESEMGYTVYDKKNRHWIVYYNDMKSETTIRFTLAHELAHIILGHEVDNDINDKEANCCARNLLAPVPVRDGYNLESIDDICECFNISEPMAGVVINLNSSDHYYITKENYDTISNRAYINISGSTLTELYG